MKIAKDKMQHFGVSAVLSLGSSYWLIPAVGSLASKAGVTLSASIVGIISAATGFVLSVAAGVALEYYQKKSKTGTFDKMDIVADVLGALLGSGAVLFKVMGI